MRAAGTVQPVQVVTGRQGVRTVTVICPHCQRRHIPGWPPGESRPGLRSAHCTIGASYDIAAPSEVPT